MRSNVRTYYYTAGTTSGNSGNIFCNILGCASLCNLSSLRSFKAIVKFVKSPTGIVMTSIWAISIIAAFPTGYFSYILQYPISKGGALDDSDQSYIKVCYPYPNELGPNYPKIVVASKFIFLYVIPTIIIGYCYVSIAIHLMYKAKSSLASTTYSSSMPFTATSTTTTVTATTTMSRMIDTTTTTTRSGLTETHHERNNSNGNNEMIAYESPFIVSPLLRMPSVKSNSSSLNKSLTATSNLNTNCQTTSISSQPVMSATIVDGGCTKYKEPKFIYQGKRNSQELAKYLKISSSSNGSFSSSSSASSCSSSHHSSPSTSNSSYKQQTKLSRLTCTCCCHRSSNELRTNEKEKLQLDSSHNIYQQGLSSFSSSSTSSSSSTTVAQPQIVEKCCLCFQQQQQGNFIKENSGEKRRERRKISIKNCQINDTNDLNQDEIKIQIEKTFNKEGQRGKNCFSIICSGDVIDANTANAGEGNLKRNSSPTIEVINSNSNTQQKRVSLDINVPQSKRKNDHNNSVELSIEQPEEFSTSSNQLRCKQTSLSRSLTIDTVENYSDSEKEVEKEDEESINCGEYLRRHSKYSTTQSIASEHDLKLKYTASFDRKSRNCHSNRSNAGRGRFISTLANGKSSYSEMKLVDSLGRSRRDGSGGYFDEASSLKSIKNRLLHLSGKSILGSINGLFKNQDGSINDSSSTIRVTTTCPGMTTSNSMPLGSISVLQKSRKKSQSRAKMILLLVVLFLICFFPNHLFMMWFYFNPNSATHFNSFWQVWRIIAFCLTFLNSTLNPITLYLTSDQFKHLFNKYLLKCFNSESSNENTGNSGDSSNVITTNK